MSNREQRQSDSSLDDIDPSIPAGSTAYWKARARQWQHRCQRAEREKTELIAELLRLQGVRTAKEVDQAQRRAAILQGDILPGRSKPPRAL